MLDGLEGGDELEVRRPRVAGRAQELARVSTATSVTVAMRVMVLFAFSAGWPDRGPERSTQYTPWQVGPLHVLELPVAHDAVSFASGVLAACSDLNAKA